MNRPLQYLNLIGVLALAVLCVAQWQHDRRLNLEFNQSEANRQTQQQEITKQAEAARGLSSDLAGFKDLFKAEHDDLEQTRRKLHTAENLATTLASQRDKLQESITNWVTAVDQRDKLFKEANSRIQGISADLNDCIRKYNDLTTHYNAVVKELNESRVKSSGTNATTNNP